jgi:hypothetical protein
MVSVFDSPVGQGEKQETVAVALDLEQQVRKLARRSAWANNVVKQIELGRVLADMLLPSYARKLLSESLKRLRDGEGLRLRLRLDGNLGWIPWEYLYLSGEHTTGGFLALNPRISIVRHDALALPGDWFEAPQQRRIVVVMATPEPHATYQKLNDLPKEQRLLKAALNGIQGVDAVYLPEYGLAQDGELRGATPDDLLGSLVERTDILHFSGHGIFDKQTSPHSTRFSGNAMPPSRLA